MSISRYLYRIVLGIKAVSLYSNWPSVLLTYLGLKSERIYSLRNGTRYYVRPNTEDFQIINDLFMNNIYGKNMPAIINTAGPVIIDIGANIGVFSIIAAISNRQAKVYSFEPFADNFSMLKRNISLNNLGNRVVPFMLGVASKSGLRELHLDHNNTGAHSMFSSGSNANPMKQEYAESKVIIRTISLAEVFKQNKIKRCDFLKLDCEGAEFEILYNAPASLLKKVRTITMEYHENSGQGKAEDMVAFLQNNGFRVVRKGSGSLGMIYALNLDATPI